MLLIHNEENNVDERCILYPVLRTPCNGAIFLDIINETLLETRSGFSSFGEVRKTGVLVEDGCPLKDIIKAGSLEIETLKVLHKNINKQR